MKLEYRQELGGMNMVDHGIAPHACTGTEVSRLEINGTLDCIVFACECGRRWRVHAVECFEARREASRRIGPPIDLQVSA